MRTAGRDGLESASDTWEISGVARSPEFLIREFSARIVPAGRRGARGDLTSASPARPPGRLGGRFIWGGAQETPAIRSALYQRSVKWNSKAQNAAPKTRANNQTARAPAERRVNLGYRACSIAERWTSICESPRISSATTSMHPSSPEPTIGDIGNCTQRPGLRRGRLGSAAGFHLGQCEWCDEPGSGGSYRLAALIAGANLNERQRRIRRHQDYRRDGLREAGGVLSGSRCRESIAC
jgi:hypothetical protein